MFESLSTKLQNITAKMRGSARVTEADIKAMMKEIRMALLEADVNYSVVKEFVADMSEKCKGADVMKSLTPGQQIVKIVHESLIELLGETSSKLAVSPSGFTVIMLYGLQGAGKTTTAAKLGNILKKNGKRPLLLSVDVHRPAAAKQLEVLAQKIDVPSFIMPEEKDPIVIAKAGIERAKYLLCDTLIVDTAGRMTVDEELMDELIKIGDYVKPHEKLLVVDAMIGQEAVAVAQSFEDRIGLDGFIMTKLDGDARGGAALSIRKMTGKPIKYICVGEKIENIEEFYPDRMADRILGMGDIVSLAEKLQQQYDEEEAKKLQKKILKDQFNFNDFLAQIQQIKKMGNLKDLASMIPGVGKAIKNLDISDDAFKEIEAIIMSMTPEERENPQIINGSRRRRIAEGSGSNVSIVNRLLKQFEETRKIMKMMSGGGARRIAGLMSKMKR